MRRKAYAGFMHANERKELSSRADERAMSVARFHAPV